MTSYPDLFPQFQSRFMGGSARILQLANLALSLPSQLVLIWYRDNTLHCRGGGGVAIWGGRRYRRFYCAEIQVLPCEMVSQNKAERLVELVIDIYFNHLSLDGL